MSDLAIRVDGISKQYRLGHALKRATLRDTLTNAAAAPFRRVRRLLRAPENDGNSAEETIWALRDVSFEVQRGEVVGIIGRNAAGKSTLLKILSRITEPSTGFAEIHGSVSSLLEVGSGFHLELTGRENIFLNGAILGMRRADIIRRFDEIVSFAEVEKFIDTPVKHYSSGMHLRLAFAVAAHLEPEILIIDEVLAVGDATFQAKCLGKMEDVASRGRTVLFVSHNMPAVENLCESGVVLAEGRVLFRGNIGDAVSRYLAAVNPSRESSAHPEFADLSRHPGRPGKYDPLLKKIELFTDEGRPVTNGLRIGGPLTASVQFTLENPTERFGVGLGFDNLVGSRILTVHSRYQPNFRPGKRVGEQVLICEIPSLTLVPGEYRIKVWLEIGGTMTDTVDDAMRLTVVGSDYYGTGRVPWNGTFVLKHRWRLDNEENGDPEALNR